MSIKKDDVKGAKIVRPKEVTPGVRLKPHIGVMLADAYTIVGEEFRSLRDRAMNRGLDREEHRQFVQMADAFAKLAREEREQEKRHDPAKYTDEELLVMVEKAKSLLAGEDE